MKLSALTLAAAMALPFTLATGTAQAGTSLVVDASSGQVLHADGAGRAWHPASTTKMMTAYLALKAVKAGRIGLETAIPASALAAKQPRVKVYIKAGQEVTLDNALKIMMVKSANDISYVIAEGVGGNVPDFINMMNAEATRLGMRDTRFANPNGWHHPQQQTSARDLAVLTMTMMREFPEYAGYWGIGAVQLGRQTLNNTNGLIGRYQGASGFKTGFVCASGFNVVATATRGGRTLIVVVLGALSGAERTVRASQLLDEAFGSWGGGYGTLASIPSGYGGQAPNICADVRARGGGGILADDADSAGPISYAPAIGGNEESGGRFATVLPVQQGRSAGVTQRGASGRVTLGPRAQFNPLQVAFGRTSGSASAPIAANVTRRADTQIARNAPQKPVPGVIEPGPAVAATAVAGGAVAGALARARTASPHGAIPASATAFAPRSEPVAGNAVGGAPMKLLGAIQPGAKPVNLAKPANAKPAAKAGAKPTATALAKPGTKPVAKPGAKPAEPIGKITPKPAPKAKAAPKPAANEG
ncbi:MAG: D-alanyl-D-alanine carboxypeptidase family protein [Bosea sp. (in: a-proteobacteria)]